jgi:Tol biopolymer transport system component
MKALVRAVTLAICLMLVLAGSSAGQAAINTQTTNTFMPLVLKKYPPILNKIVFLGWTEFNTQDIFTMNEDGSELQNLTADPTRIGSASWSPDGTKLAFISNWEGNYEIYVINIDGSGMIQLTNDPGYDTSPSWSLDGTRIAFTSNRSGTWQVYVMNSDGSEVTPLTSITSGCQYPLWSPDGDKIACTSMGTTYNDADIYTLNPDGSGLTQLTVNAYYDRMLEWSPDGSRILFLSNRDNEGEVSRLDLFVMHRDGTEALRLTQGGYAQAGSWAPEGDRIVYSDWDIENEGTFIIDVDGSDNTPLLCQSQEFVTYDPDWSPDGNLIAFAPSDCSINPDGTTCGIYTVNIDGSECTQRVAMLASDPIWAPGD